MIDPDRILAIARSYLKTPFRHQGRVPGHALDCAGLVISVAKELGVEHFDVAGYGPYPSGKALEANLDSQPCLQRIPIAERQPGDILLMRFSSDPQHLAIDAGENVIHSYELVGAAVEHRLSSSWRARIVRVYRFREIA